MFVQPHRLHNSNHLLLRPLRRSVEVEQLLGSKLIGRLSAFYIVAITALRAQLFLAREFHVIF